MIKCTLHGLIAGLICATLASAAPDGSKLVKASLLNDTVAAQAGQPFRVGVSFEIEPGYHIYWKNPGESGQPPEVKWKLPEGYTASELQWPAPKKFMVPGAIFNYGYDDRVTLLATITPPPGATTGSAEIAADISWLVCNDDACIPGSGRASLVWPDASVAALNAKFLDQVAATVPTNVEQSTDVLSVRPIAGDSNQLRIEWKHAVAKTEFFPADDTVKVQQSSVSTNKMSNPPVTVLEVYVQPTAGVPTPAMLPGVLAYESADGHRRGVELSVPVNMSSP